MRIRDVHHELNVYGEEGGIALVPLEGTDATELTYPRYLPEFDIDALLASIEVIVASRLPRDIRKRAPRLRWVQYLGADIDHLMAREELLKAEFTITNALETLAERTLALAQLERKKNPEAGFTPQLLDFVRPILKRCFSSGIKIVTDRKFKPTTTCKR